MYNTFDNHTQTITGVPVRAITWLQKQKCWAGLVWDETSPNPEKWTPYAWDENGKCKSRRPEFDLK